MKTSACISFLVDVLEKGLSTQPRLPDWLQRLYRYSVPSKFASTDSMPNLKAVAGVTMMIGFLWLGLFGMLLMRTNQLTRGGTTPLAAYETEWQVMPSEANQRGLPAVVLNEQFLRREIYESLTHQSRAQAGNIMLKVKVGPTGQYITHEVLYASSEQLTDIAESHILKIDCLPALMEGKAVSSWIRLSFQFVPHK